MEVTIQRNPITPLHALIVDDDLTARIVLQELLQQIGYEVSIAEDGNKGLEVIHQKKSTLDVILLDREMPKMNGLDVVENLKQDQELKHIPVLIQSGSTSEKQIRDAFNAGVFYHIAKPIDADVLKSVISDIARKAQHLKILNHDLEKHRKKFNLITNCAFQYRTLSEAEDIACFIAYAYPDPARVISGLIELFANAVEYGILELGYSEKTWLLKAGTWKQELLRRIDLPEHKNKKVEVTLKRKANGIYLKVCDQGQGFDWQKYMQLDPSRAHDNHGRGIAIANSVSFDSITYNDIGNEVTAYVEA